MNRYDAYEMAASEGRLCSECREIIHKSYWIRKEFKHKKPLLCEACRMQKDRIKNESDGE
jgi:hypothetical protein